MEQSEFRMRYHAASDLVRQGKCVEAMAILDALDQAFPNSREIMWARAQCLKRLNGWMRPMGSACVGHPV